MRKTIKALSSLAVLTLVFAVLAAFAVSAAVGSALSERAQRYDVNKDDTVNIVDVSDLLNYLSNPGEEGDEPTYTSATFVIGKVTVSPGSTTVQIPISVVNNPGVASIALDVAYDSALTLTGVEFNSAFGGSTITSQSLASPAYISWVNYSQNYEEDAVFATLTFDVTGVSNGAYSISATYDEDNVYNINEDNIHFDVVNGSIIVK